MPEDADRSALVHRQGSGWQGAASSAMHSAEGEGGSVAYKGMVDCFARTVKEEGWQALFKVLV